MNVPGYIALWEQWRGVLFPGHLCLKTEWNGEMAKINLELKHIPWAGSFKHKFSHQLQEQGEPTFTTFIQDQWGVHHWGQNLASPLENHA